MTERTIYASDIAGHCTEVAAWRLIHDIALEMQNGDDLAVIKPSLIVIREDGGFTLEKPVGEVAVDGFDAPECSQKARTAESAVWSLGATVFYVMMGCQVMNGKGGIKQTAQSRIPYLRHGMPALSELTQRCLHYNPLQRPALDEIVSIATENLKRCEAQIHDGPAFKKAETESAQKAGGADGFWPEEMKIKN